MPDEVLKERLDKHDRPKNIEHLLVTKVNQPVWDKLRHHTRSVDLKLQRTQNSLVKGLCTLVTTMDKFKKGTDDRQEIYKGLIDALSLFTNTDRELIYARREALKPDLNQNYKNLCSAEITGFSVLFGTSNTDLTQEVENIQKLQKLGNKLTYRGRGRGRGRGVGRSRGRGRRPDNFYYPNYANPNFQQYSQPFPQYTQSQYGP